VGSRVISASKFKCAPHGTVNRPRKKSTSSGVGGWEDAAFEGCVTETSWPGTWWMWELEELKYFVAMCWHA